MFEIRVVGEFSAAHNLRGYRGRCEELHGHNWRVEVVLSGKKLDKIGMLMDFKEIKSRLNKVLDKLDHKHLNALSYFKKTNPTSENIARYVYDCLKLRVVPNGVSHLESVTVWESDSSSTTYYGE